MEGIRCSLLALLNRVSPVRSTNTRWSSTDSIVPPPLHSPSNSSSENNITGDVLVVLDTETLKEIGVTTVGQRLSILKHIYRAKLAHNVPIEPDHYIPPCMLLYLKSSRPDSHVHVAEAGDKPEGLNVDKLYQIVKEQGTVVIASFNYQFSPLAGFRWSLFEAVRLRSLEFENRRLSEDVRGYVEDVNTFRASWSRVVRRC